MGISFTDPVAYDFWYEQFPDVFGAELRAIRTLFPENKRFIEIGVGTGRFAGALGIEEGVDISKPMLDLAVLQGVRCIRGSAESLPVASGSYDGVLFVTVVSFLADPLRAFREARRVVGPSGWIIIAFLNKSSPMVEKILSGRKHTYFADAHFYSAEEIIILLRDAGFASFQCVHTLQGALVETDPNEPILRGVGNGGFAVISAKAL